MKVHFAGHEDVGMSKPLKKAGVNMIFFNLIIGF